MARAALPGRLTWQLGRVTELVPETSRTTSISLELPDWPGYRAGQHVDVRLTAEDGYQAQRSYSIASGPDDGRLQLTVERLDDGEVSPYLADVLQPGDELELRGPIGGYFVWEERHAGPVLMIAGGSGVVPFRSMLRRWVATGAGLPVRLLYSTRSLDEVIYRRELDQINSQTEAEIVYALTRAWPQDWTGHRGRIDADLLDEVAWPPGQDALIFVCGPSGFVEAAAGTLVARGHPPGSIRTERFGPSGT
jgi:ferredoxin-NADP reductase